MNRDLHSRYKAVQHLECKAYTTTQAPANGIDTQGFDSLDFLIMIGAITSADASPAKGWQFTVEESDSQSSGFTAVTDASQLLFASAKSPISTGPDATTGAFPVIADPAKDQDTYRVGYLGSKRYVKISIAAINTPGSTPLGIVALLGWPVQEPTAD